MRGERDEGKGGVGGGGGQGEEGEEGSTCSNLHSTPPGGPSCSRTPFCRFKQK